MTALHGPGKFGLAFDPGYANLGVALLNIETSNATVLVADLGKYGGIDHELGYSDFGPLVFDLVASLPNLLGVPDLWSSLAFVGIERQPHIGTRNVLQCASHIESCVRARTPKTPLFQVDPRSVRTFWGTGGKDYKDRKKRSREVALLSPGDTKRARFAFSKQGPRGKVFKVDGLEALQLAVYTRHNMGKLGFVPVVPGEPRKFQVMQLKGVAAHNPEARANERRGG